MDAKGDAKRRALAQWPLSSAANDSGRTKTLDSEGPSRRFELMPSKVISRSDNRGRHVNAPVDNLIWSSLLVPSLRYAENWMNMPCLRGRKGRRMSLGFFLMRHRSHAL